MMATFFQGWRRKLGTGLLITGCLGMAGWLRSLDRYDEVAFAATKRVETQSVHFTIDKLMLVGYSIVWKRTWEQVEPSDATMIEFIEELYHDSTWTSSSRRPNFNQVTFNHECDIMKWRWRAFGFGVCESSLGSSHSVVMLFIPYWSIVLPLSLVSALLLLTKPRAKLTLDS